jgi:hypothetical protein
MYRKGEVSYQPLPLPDRVQQDDAGSLASARPSLPTCASAIRCATTPPARSRSR